MTPDEDTDNKAETTTRAPRAARSEAAPRGKVYGKQTPGLDYEAALEKGYIGTVPDTTPNENYTVDGVTSGKPTPETDDEQRVAVRGTRR